MIRRDERRETRENRAREKRYERREEKRRQKSAFLLSPSYSQVSSSRTNTSSLFSISRPSQHPLSILLFCTRFDLCETYSVSVGEI